MAVTRKTAGRGFGLPFSLVFGDRVAKGSERQVHRVVDEPDVLLKTMRRKYLSHIGPDADRSFLGWLRVQQAYALYRRELRAYANAMVRAAIRQELPPLAGLCGLVLTEKGLGQLVERISSADGGMALTLEELLATGPLAQDRLEALNHFVAALYDWHIPAYDLGPKNILWDEMAHRFVLVDGFGDRAVIPLKTWVRTLNNRRLDRAFAVLARKSGLAWQRRARQFSRAAPAA